MSKIFLINSNMFNHLLSPQTEGSRKSMNPRQAVLYVLNKIINLNTKEVLRWQIINQHTKDQLLTKL